VNLYMRYSQSEKIEMIRLVEGSQLEIKKTFSQLGLNRRTFYKWYRSYQRHGFEGLARRPSERTRFWNVIPDMTSASVKVTLDEAIQKSGVDQVPAYHPPRLLTENGSSFVSRELSEYLLEQGMLHTRGKPYHPMTQGKIERYHRSLKNVINLHHHYSPSELEAEIGLFVAHYNNYRYHESLNNTTPADVYFGRDKEILNRRNRTKKQTTGKEENLLQKENEVREGRN